ncbi:MAG: deoxyribodipyrimidine photo-lyase [Ginsengibacter sp.]
MINNKPISVFWFRRDLRLIDNHGLFRAFKSKYEVMPLFIFDKNILEGLTVKKDKRVSFIYQSLEKINKECIKNNSSLLILHDTPLRAFKNLCSSFTVKEVFANHDYEPYALKRDKEVGCFLETNNIIFHTFKDQVLFEKSEILKSDGSPYSIYTPYSRIWKIKLSEEKIHNYKSEKLISRLLKTKPFEFPSLKQLGFEKIIFRVPPERVNQKIITAYEKTRNIPSINGTSKLSVHLRFGTVSIRKLVKTAMCSNQIWLNELIWREFFMMILFHNPEVVSQSFKKKYDKIQWRNNEKEFELWCKGQTGYPIVDAGMRELNETGFMHNRVRMIVASFLTKHLLIDWRWGEAYFAEKLLDYELSSNNGNWQWAAGCGCDAAPYFRIFNPLVQAKIFDPEFLYVKKWIKNFSSGYLEPIVDHKFARERALNKYKKALK